MEAPRDGDQRTSLILCSRNRPHLLAEAVASILAGDELPSELVIVDQSDDPHPTLRTEVTHRGCVVRYISSRSVGLSRARNEGVASARSDLLAFTDDDVLVTPGWLRALVGALRSAGPLSVVTGQVLPGVPSQPGAFAPSTKVDETPRTYCGRTSGDVLFAGNMAMFRSTIEEIGRFDERLGAGAHFPSSEDNDFCYRLLQAGYCIVYVPEAVLYHQAWRTSRQLLRLRLDYGRGQGAYFAKHLRLRDRYMLGRLVRHMARYLRRSVRRSAREPSRAVGDLAYVIGTLSGATEWLLTQRKTH